MIKMFHVGGPGVGYVHTSNCSYNLQETVLMVWPEDVEELQAAGFGVPHYANQLPSSNHIPTEAERSDLAEEYRRAKQNQCRKLAHPERKNRLVPMQGAKRSVTCEGRVYTIPEGLDFIDAPQEDVRFLIAQARWLDFGLVGPTEDRPVNPPAMATFIDLTIGCMLLFDGQDWRYPVNGEAF